MKSIVDKIYEAKENPKFATAKFQHIVKDGSRTWEEPMWHLFVKMDRKKFDSINKNYEIYGDYSYEDFYFGRIDDVIKDWFFTAILKSCRSFDTMASKLNKSGLTYTNWELVKKTEKSAILASKYIDPTGKINNLTNYINIELNDMRIGKRK